MRDQYVCKYTRVVPYYSTYKEVVPVYYIEPKKLNFFSTAYNYFFYSFNTTSYLLYRYSYKSYLYTNGLRSCISYYSSYKPNLYYTNTIVKSNNMYVSKEDTYNICNTYMFTYIFYKEKYLWNFISNFHKKGKKKKVLNVLFTVLQLVKQVTGLSVYKLLRSFSLDYKKKSFASITTTIKTKNFIKPYLYSYKKRFKLWILYFLKKTKSTYLDTVLSIAEIIAYQVVLYLHTTNLIEATYSEKENVLNQALYFFFF